MSVEYFYCDCHYILIFCFLAHQTFSKTMEIVVWLIFILATLFILITLALVNCAELPEDHSTEKKKNTTPIPKGMCLCPSKFILI